MIIARFNAVTSCHRFVVKIYKKSVNKNKEADEVNYISSRDVFGLQLVAIEDGLFTTVQY